MKKISSGKVREICEVDNDKLMMVVSDRISAFDFIMPNPVADKGKILNKISFKKKNLEIEVCLLKN